MHHRATKRTAAGLHASITFAVAVHHVHPRCQFAVSAEGAGCSRCVFRPRCSLRHAVHLTHAGGALRDDGAAAAGLRPRARRCRSDRKLPAGTAAAARLDRAPLVRSQRQPDPRVDSGRPQSGRMGRRVPGNGASGARGVGRRGTAGELRAPEGLRRRRAAPALDRPPWPGRKWTHRVVEHVEGIHHPRPCDAQHTRQRRPAADAQGTARRRAA